MPKRGNRLSGVAKNSIQFLKSPAPIYGSSLIGAG
jgi:hypothetical protein